MTGATTANKTNHQAPSKASVKAAKSAAFARKVVEEAFTDSTIQDGTDNYPKFDLDEITKGKVLGKGGFGTVWEVRAFDADSKLKNLVKTSFRRLSVTSNSNNDDTYDDEDPTAPAGEMESRKFIAQHCVRKSGEPRYAVKMLSPEVVKNQARHFQGLIDLAIETRFLSHITDHPNIIKMRAIATMDPYEKGYFLVMDRLCETLGKRLKKWEGRAGRTKGFAGRLSDRKGRKAADLYEERIVAAFDLASAIEYLHERNILYRDIKPENIGFDIRDDIKIFDFGLAKELRDTLRSADGTYKLTDMTGSPRYMAPEIANGEPYNATCDVYSFAILLWEILALKTPFELYTPKLLRMKVYNGEHKRPLVDESWSPSIKLLLKRSWAKDLHDRNTMAQNVTILRKECVSARDGDESGLEHQRRRSTFVFRPKGDKKAFKREMLSV